LKFAEPFKNLPWGYAVIGKFHIIILICKLDGRVPGVQAVTEEYITQRQLRGICAQRNLDSLFQKHSNNSDFFQLYFGSVDGTFRIFPGMVMIVAVLKKVQSAADGILR